MDSKYKASNSTSRNERGEESSRYADKPYFSVNGKPYKEVTGGVIIDERNAKYYTHELKKNLPVSYLKEEFRSGSGNPLYPLNKNCFMRM